MMIPGIMASVSNNPDVIMSLNAQKIAVVLFVLWGLLHIVGGATMAFTQGADVLKLIGSSLAASELPDKVDPATSGILKFHGYNMLWLGVLVTILAIGMWQRADPTRFWISMFVVGAADIGLVLFLLAPGVMAPGDGWAGPLLWVLAACFGTMGLRRSRSFSNQPSL
jgi:hypothetical protein